MPNFNYKCKCNEPAKKSIVKKDGPNKGREFYACAKKPGSNCNFFKWENKDLAQSHEEDEGHSDDDDRVICVCGAPAYKFMVNKPGPNKGRYFYGCPKSQDSTCGFFQWADKKVATKPENGLWEEFKKLQENKTNTENGEDIICVCGEPARKFVVKKEGANKGRSFYGCPKGQESTCGFFQWADIDVAARKQPSAVQQPSENDFDCQWDEDEDLDRGDDQNRLDDQYTAGTLNSVGNREQVRCICDQPARLQTVQKDGVNKGREFYTCSKESPKSCGFFDWAQDYSTRSTGGQSRSIPVEKKPVQLKKGRGDKKYGSLF